MMLESAHMHLPFFSCKNVFKVEDWPYWKMLSNDFTQMSSILLTTSQIRKLKKIVIKFWLLHFCLTNYDRNIYSESTCLGRLKQCSLIDKWIIPTWLTNQIQAMILICKKYACEFTGTGLMILRKYFLLVLNLFIVNKLALKQESEVLTGWIPYLL